MALTPDEIALRSQELRERADKRRQRRQQRMAFLREYGPSVNVSDLEQTAREADIDLAQAAMQDMAGETGGFLDTVGTIVENSPLAGIVETVGGLLSLPVEGAYQLEAQVKGQVDPSTGEKVSWSEPLRENPETFELESARYKEQLDLGEYLANFNPYGLMFNMIGVGTSDSALRKRGREFFSRASEADTAAFERVTGFSQYSTPQDREDARWIRALATPGYIGQSYISAVEERGHLTPEQGHQFRRMSSEMFAQSITDPLVLVDLAPKALRPSAGIAKSWQALKASKTGQRLIEKYPRLALAPEKFWKRLNGKVKEARALGDPRAEAFYAAHAIDESDIGTEALALKQALLQREIEALSPLTPDEVGKVKDLLPRVVEPKKPEILAQASERSYRELLAGMETSDEKLQKALADMAETYQWGREADIAFRSRWGNQAAEFSGQFDYLGRKFSPELATWFSNKPDALAEIAGAKLKYSEAAMDTALDHFEKTRKLRDFDFEDAEKYVRGMLKEKYGLPDNIPIWSREHVGDLAARFDKAAAKTSFRKMHTTFAHHFGEQLEAPNLAVAKQLVDEVADRNAAKAWANEMTAALRYGEAQAETAAFREGRKALRDIGAQSSVREITIPTSPKAMLKLIDPQTTPMAAQYVRTMNPNKKADVTYLRDLLKMELSDARRAVPSAAERHAGEMGMAGARVGEARVVTAESGEGSRIAYQMGRDAEHKAVPIAEALREEALDIVSKTPGATEAREALKQARKMLAQAKKTEDLQLAAADIARAFGFELPTGATHDAVSAAEEAVKFVKQHIRTNPAIKNADQALRAANQMLAEARQVAAKVETGELATHLDDLLKSANEAQDINSIGAKYVTTAMKREIEKAKKIADEVVDYYAKRAEGATPAELEHVNRSVRDVRAALSKMRAELRKDAPASLLRVFDRAYAQAERIAGRLGIAQQAVGKPVAKAVRAAESKAAKEFHEALLKAANSDPETWSAAVKAEFIQHAMRKHGVTPGPGETTALDIWKKSNLELPDNIEDLVSLATTRISADDAKWFSRWSEDFYRIQSLTPENWVARIGNYMDRFKAVLQRTWLAVPKSAVKDVQGTMMQGVFPAVADPKVADELARAATDLGGDPMKWAQGIGKGYTAPEDVLRLTADGTLTTTIDEATHFANLPPTGSKFAKAGRRIEERGLLAAITPDVKLPGLAKGARKVSELAARKGAGKVAELASRVGGKLEQGLSRTVQAATDIPLYTRQWTEQVLRLAVYRAARKRGLSHADAMEDVFQYFGKFGEKGRAERWIGRGIFFSEWWTRSIPITLRNLLDHPAQSKLYLNLLRGNTADDQTMPEWARRQGGWSVGFDKSGNAQVIRPGGGLFMGPTYSVLQSDMMKAAMQGDPQVAASEAGREVFRATVPAYQWLVEGVSEHDYFSNRDWYANPKERTGSQAQAPMGFYWLTNLPGRDPDKPYEPGLIEGVLGLEAKTDKDGNLRYMTMEPRWAWLFGGVPGAEPVMQDLSAFIDPREIDVPYGEYGLSVRKGAMRQAGLPMYNIPVTPKQVAQVKELRKALRQEADSLSGGALKVSDYGRIVADQRTPRGRDLADVIEMTTKEGRALGLRGVKLQQHVERKLTRNFQAEWRLLELDRRLALLEDYYTDKESGAIPAK